jgi:hypothetical protein
VRNISIILEAIEYAEQEGIPWYNIIGTDKEAKKILNRAKKEILDEYELIRLAEYTNTDLYSNDHEIARLEAFTILKEELEEPEFE